MSIPQGGQWWVGRIHRGAAGSAGLGLGAGSGKAFLEWVTQICALKVRERRCYCVTALLRLCGDACLPV